MKLLFVACLHNSEDFEPWLLPYLEKGATVYPFDYRTMPDPNRNLITTVETLGIDSVFIVKGESISAETIRYLNNIGVKTGVWTIDDHAHPELYTAPYTHLWTPTPGLIEEYKRRCKNVHELAFYVEPKLFAQTRDFVNIEDVSFLGTRYAGREDKITNLRTAGLDVALWGDQWTIKNNGRIQRYLDCLDLWHNTKVNLNIHQKTMRELSALNTKMYEIPAAGGFMVTDYFPEVLRKFASDEVALYDTDDPNSLLETVKRFLTRPDERRTVMERARTRILTEHTAERRAEQVLMEFQ